jgi:hypothetical protein
LCGAAVCGPHGANKYIYIYIYIYGGGVRAAWRVFILLRLGLVAVLAWWRYGAPHASLARLPADPSPRGGICLPASWYGWQCRAWRLRHLRQKSLRGTIVGKLKVYECRKRIRVQRIRVYVFYLFSVRGILNCQQSTLLQQL